MSGATRGRPPGPGLPQRALGGHAAIGLLASALLYLIALTGTLIVIHDRWQRWEQPGVPELTALAPDAVQAAMAGMAARSAAPTSHLYIRLPTPEMPRATVTTDAGGWYVDAAGRPVARDRASWTTFMIGLHEYLHLPASWGMIAVGALGVAMAALVVTGVLAHPRIVRDAFRLRSRHDPQLARADWHNRLGVWTLPFALAVSITGAFIGLGSVGYAVLARAYTGGDLEATYAPIYGHEPAPDTRAAPLPDVATALRTLAARVPTATPTYAIVHEPGTRGQHVQIIAEHPRRLIYGETYAFDARGGWRGPVGLADGALGQQAAASAYNLHFGNFGGLPVELAYLAFGFAFTAVTATGTTLWLGKRQRRGLGGARLQACWCVVVWGCPLLMVATLWLTLLAGPDVPLVPAFWGTLAAALVAASVRPGWVGPRMLRRVLAVAVAVTAVGHLLIARQLFAIDGVALFAAVVALVAERPVRASAGARTAPAARALSTHPAPGHG